MARSAFSSPNVQNTACLDHFLKFRCRNWEETVARSTCPSQNAQNTPAPDHFLLFRCRMVSKNGTRLWRKPHVEVKRTKHRMLRPLFEFQMQKMAGDCGAKRVCKSKPRTTFLKFRCRNIARRCGTKYIYKSKCPKHLCFGEILEVSQLAS